VLKRFFAPRRGEVSELTHQPAAERDRGPAPGFAPLPLFGRRSAAFTAAFEAYHLWTAHRTTLVAAEEAGAMAHRHFPAAGREIILFHAICMPQIGLLVSPRGLEPAPGFPGGSIVPVLILGEPGSGAFSLRAPTRALFLSALALNEEVGALALDRTSAGPWEHFHAVRAAAPPISAEVEATLERIAPLLEQQLDPSLAADWIAQARDPAALAGVPVLLHLLARHDLAQQVAERRQALSGALHVLAAPQPALMAPRTGPLVPAGFIDLRGRQSGTEHLLAAGTSDRTGVVAPPRHAPAPPSRCRSARAMRVCGSTWRARSISGWWTLRSMAGGSAAPASVRRSSRAARSNTGCPARR